MAAPIAQYNISVCLASYNGERFIKQQIDSILPQLEEDDELIIVDDCSTDKTVKIIQSYGDNRIVLFLNEQNLGVNQAFEKAISMAQKDMIFMSDQDDVWIPGRVSLMRDTLIKTACLLVSSNSLFIDSLGNETLYPADGVSSKDSKKYIRNILHILVGKKNYYGCAMAFRREFVDLILPIPSCVESHDLWIALASNIKRSNVHLEFQTVKRRVHGSNASILKRSMVKKAVSRFIFLHSIIVLLYRSYLKRVI